MVRLSKALYLTSPIVSILAGIVVGVGIFFVEKADVSGGAPYLAIGGLGCFYSAILALILYYKMWESIKDGHARTSPGKAVGFLFIPFFNLYWIFQVLWGFSQDYNAYVDRHAVNTKKLPEGLFLAASILPLTTWVPFLNILTIIAYWVVFVIVVSQVCDAVNALPVSDGGLRPPLDDVQVPVRAAGPLPSRVGAAGPLARGARLGFGALSLYCVSGEFAHQTLVVPPDGVSIGRDPTRVNLVFAATEISGVHARVFPDVNPAQVWLEDLHSLNGTFYRQRAMGGPGESGWVKLQGKILLSPGAHFRLALDGPEFEIRGS
jgi:FHA domain-containing protein